jgi:hypothetical protein
MATRRVHYESAFEDYLRVKGQPYVCVDDAKRAIFGKVSLKSFDFVVYSEGHANLLVDVKGRKFPDLHGGGAAAKGRAWENWITKQDIDSLGDWQRVFGGGFSSTLVFAYWLQGAARHAPFDDVHLYRGKQYAFMAVSLDEYVKLARPRSAKWQTLSLPTRDFVAHAVDVGELL